MNVNVSPLKLLAISFSYPPSALPRAVQVARLLKNLDLPTVLVCAAYEEKDVRKDPALVSESEAFLTKCLRVPFTVSRWRNLMGRVAYRFDLPVFNKSPDQFTSWRHPVVKAVNDFLQSNQNVPDALVTFGSPMSDHLIGLNLKERWRLPWIAHFSDPWVDNPFAASDPASKAINRALEHKVLSAADKVIFTSRETLDLVMAKYPVSWKSKAGVVPHALDPRLFSRLSKAENSKITVRYLGDFYGPRTPAPLLKALSHLLASNPAILEDVHFETIGTLGDLKVEELGVDSLPHNLVTVKPPVSYLESLSLMTSADGLLVIDAPAEQSVFLPSKLIDYIGAGRPVLGITPPGTASTLIRELGGWVADPSDGMAVAQQIATFITYLRDNSARKLSDWGDPLVRSRYEASTVARAFVGILREVVA